MAAIPYPDPASLAPETVELLRRNGTLNVTRMMAHSVPVLEAYARLGFTLLRRGQLDPLLRELAILRVGCLNRSDYEWRQHVGLARALGADEAALAAVKSGETSTLSGDQRLVVTFAEEVCRLGSPSRALLDKAKARFSPAELVELVLVCGFYVMTAMYLNTLQIESEDTPPLSETIAARLSLKDGTRS